MRRLKLLAGVGIFGAVFFFASLQRDAKFSESDAATTAPHSVLLQSRTQVDGISATISAPLSVRASEADTLTPSRLQAVSADMESCPQICQSRLMEHFRSGKDFSETDIALIEQNAEVMASLLIKQPRYLAALLSSLSSEDDDESHLRRAASAVSNAIPSEDKVRLGRQLLNKFDPTDREVGLELLGNTILDDAGAAAALNVFVRQEDNPRVLIKVIDIVELASEDERALDQALPALDALIEGEHADFVWGAALMTKTKLAPLSGTADADVRQALGNTSSEMRQYGVQALSILSARRKARDEEAGLTSPALRADQGLETLLNDIIDDGNVDPSMRQLALSLIRGQ